MTPQRILQALVLSAFVGALALAVALPTGGSFLAAFLQLDPAALLAAGLASRAVPVGWGLAVLLLGLTAVLGRFFCGHACPLGTTIDVLDHLLRRWRRPAPGPTLRAGRYGVLGLVVATSLLGVSGAFLAAPLVLATRLYGLVALPAAWTAGNDLLDRVRPLADTSGFTALSMVELRTWQVDLPLLAGSIGLVLAGLALVAPRAWCRLLCPAGALFGLAGSWPLVRRHVQDTCTDCGACQRRCPTGAIGTDPRRTTAEACITCQACVRICPTRAVRFSVLPPRPTPLPRTGPSEGRRLVVAGSLAGIGLAALGRVDLRGPRETGNPGALVPEGLLRPPGARPEIGFQDRCIQCGACVAACPTNALHPTGLAAGFAAIHTPRFLPRQGPCTPGCTACGDVCPTGALRPLGVGEKPYARIGTARIRTDACIAWVDGRECAICDEFCAYGAIEIVPHPHRSARVPVVEATRCNGCGLCEYNCPVEGTAAIRVEPVGAIRLEAGSFREAAGAAGFHIQSEDPFQRRLGDDELPPGFTPAG